MVFQVRVGSEDHKNTRKTNSRIARILRHNQNMTSLCWKEGKEVIDDNTNHRGARMVFLTMNSIDTWKTPSVDVDYDTFVERFQENAID